MSDATRASTTFRYRQTHCVTARWQRPSYPLLPEPRAPCGTRRSGRLSVARAGTPGSCCPVRMQAGRAAEADMI
jgi:hypothetical protein